MESEYGFPPDSKSLFCLCKSGLCFLGQFKWRFHVQVPTQGLFGLKKFWRKSIGSANVQNGGKKLGESVWNSGTFEILLPAYLNIHPHPLFWFSSRSPRWPAALLAWKILPPSRKECNYVLRASQSSLHLIKFLVNIIHIYGSKIIYYKNTSRN